VAEQVVVVELHYSGAWNAAPVYERDPVTITRGYAGESRSQARSTATFALDNRDGDYNPGNPMSALYGLAGRNTPVRVTVGGDVRFVGEASAWKPRRTLDFDQGAGRGNAWTEVEASGILRRMGRGNDPLRSAQYRAISGASPTAYWPLEDGKLTSAPRESGGGAPATNQGAVAMRAVEGPAGSSNLPDLSSALARQISAPVTMANTGEWAVDFDWRAKVATDGTDFLGHTPVGWLASAGTYGRFNLIAGSQSGGGVLELYAYPISAPSSPDSAVGVVDLGGTFGVYDGAWRHVRITAAQNGGNIDFELHLDGASVASGSLAGTLGPPVLISAPGEYTDGVGGASDGLASAGHLTVWDTSTPALTMADAMDAFNGHAGEQAHERGDRLCTELGVTFVCPAGSPTERLGAQTPITFADLMAEAETTDGGLLYETRDALGLTYRTRSSLYNQPAVLALDATGGQLAPGLEPNLDDKATRNDISVKRRDGATVRREQLTGPMSVLAPPDGVGRTAATVNVNTQTDDDLGQHAGWHLHLGTCDETRWPRLTVDLDAAPQLVTAAAAVDVGDIITVDHLNPGTVTLMALGYVEVIGTRRRKITYNCAPEAPWEVWQLDTAGSTLTKAAAAAATSLTMDTAAGPEWSTVDEPYNVQVDGEAMTVTAMAVDTITFVAAGAVDHDNNASVTPGLPAGLAEGDLLLVWAAIRNSGTGTPDTPAGYELLADASNARLFGKYAAAGETGPTITFTGGAGGADTSAQTAAFRGAGLQLDDGAYATTTPSPQTQLNGSAQDIAYPALSVRRNGCVVLYLGWKLDDWTSVAAIAGATEIGEPDTDVGADQGIVWGYVIQTTAANIPAGSFVVTGGTSQISRGATLALRPTQTATVTRAVNDVTKALTVGEAVNGWRLGAVAL
jgi:hypothetical protein